MIIILNDGTIKIDNENKSEIIQKFLLFASHLPDITNLDEMETKRIVFATSKLLKREDVSNLPKEFNKEKLDTIYRELGIKKFIIEN
jgi:hypothetical protein